MLGLIKKDLLMIKSSMRVFAICLVAYVILGIIEGENYIISYLPAFVVFMMMTTFSYDEYNKSDAYISTLPCGKKNVVKAKYLTTIILFIAFTLLSICYATILSFTNSDLQLQDILVTILGVIFGVSIFQCVFYPMIYKFGIEKSRIAIIILVFGFVGIIALLSKLNININLSLGVTNFLDNYWFIIFPLIEMLVIYISYRISAHIYMKKEF
ncbi:MAG: ABC-2 transporter permease [Bacilli bacterium]|nr:ABC-2 transporter permease [Bacilli bacterium]